MATAIEQSSLLSLAAELRVLIFTFVLAQARCHRPIILRDTVSIAPSVLTSNTTAVLRTCRTMYNDCLSILYDKPVEVSIRHNKGYAPMASLGLIENCSLLTRLRYIELEVVFDCHSTDRMYYSIDRLRRFVGVLNASSRLKTMELFLYHQGSRYRGHSKFGDNLLLQIEALQHVKFVGVSRNLAAKDSMNMEVWDSLRRKAEGFDAAKGEQFQEISFDHWDRIP